MNYPVRMQHEHYGFHHAYDWTEVEKMKKNGWVIEGGQSAKPIDPFEEAPEKRKPGRPRKE